MNNSNNITILLITTNNEWALCYKEKSCQPFIVAHYFNKEDNTWGAGHYFVDIFSAINFWRYKVMNIPTYDRLTEIATHAIHQIANETTDYFFEDIALEENEMEYFDIEI